SVTRVDDGLVGKTGEQFVFEAVHDLGEARVVPAGRSGTAGKQGVTREEDVNLALVLRFEDERHRARGVTRSVDHVQGDSPEDDLFTPGEFLVRRTSGDVHIRRMQIPGHPETVFDRVESVDVVQVAVGGEYRLHGEAVTRLEDPLRLGGGVDHDRRSRLGTGDDIRIVVIWPDDQLCDRDH